MFPLESCPWESVGETHSLGKRVWRLQCQAPAKSKEQNEPKSSLLELPPTGEQTVKYRRRTHSTVDAIIAAKKIKAGKGARALHEGFSFKS